jgi:hypothetical protein
MVKLRVKVVELLPSAVMISHYKANRRKEVGHVAMIPVGRHAGTRPGGSAPS